MKIYSIRAVCRLLVSFALGVMKCIARVLPIRDRLIIFESSGDFSDNSYALYAYIKKKDLYKFVWIVNDDKRFKNTNDTMFLAPSKVWDRIRTVYFFSVARIAFNTHGSRFAKASRIGQTFVSLWHGTPLKAGKGGGKQMCDYMISIGRHASQLQSRFSNFPEDRILPLGYPRNDLLLSNLASGVDNPLVNHGRFVKIIVWMPTFRAAKCNDLSESSLDNDTGLPLLSTEADVETLNSFLCDKKILIILKIHPLQMEKKVFSLHFSNILFVQDKNLIENKLQLYEVIGKSDALITDYSSVLFDYLLTGKPQGFIVDDIDKYSKSRGFLVDNIEDYLPGHLIKSINELCEFLNDVVAGSDNYLCAREKLKQMIFDNPDDMSCQRICECFSI